MSLHPLSLEPIPEETVRIARAAFRKSSVAMVLRDEFGALYKAEKFAPLYPSRGRPAESPEILALASILQVIEGLTDRQAAEAVRGRIDWKYCLGLQLDDRGFDYSILSDFRERLLEHGAERQLFEWMLEFCRERDWLKAGGLQRTDSTQVLGAIRSLNRLETAVETFRNGLNTLAATVPKWLKPLLQPHWVELYGKRVEESRLPQKRAARQKFAEQLGRDGMALLEAIDSPQTESGLRFLPALMTLRRVWIEQFQYINRRLCWRQVHEQPPAPRRTVSPYDPEARAAAKGDKSWEGYKTHLTETVDPDAPQLIVNVQTSPASNGDSDDLPKIHDNLQRLKLLPKKHLGDGNYGSAEGLLQSRQKYGVDLVVPARPDTSVQARAGAGFGAENFEIHFEEQYAVCPGAKRSQTFSERPDRRYNHPMIFIRFSKLDCQPCALRELCTRAKQGARSLQIHPQAEYEALAEARRRQQTPEFDAIYDKRAGIEGTISQAQRRGEIHQSRFRSLAKVALRDLMLGTALNVVRIYDWLNGTERASTRRASFVQLAEAS